MRQNIKIQKKEAILLKKAIDMLPNATENMQKLMVMIEFDSL